MTSSRLRWCSPLTKGRVIYDEYLSTGKFGIVVEYRSPAWLNNYCLAVTEYRYASATTSSAKSSLLLLGAGLFCATVLRLSNISSCQVGKGIISIQLEILAYTYLYPAQSY